MPRLTSEHFRWQRARIYEPAIYLLIYTLIYCRLVLHTLVNTSSITCSRGVTRKANILLPPEKTQPKCRKSRPCSRCAIWKLRSDGNKVVSFRCTEEMETLVARKIVRALKGSLMNIDWYYRDIAATTPSANKSSERYSREPFFRLNINWFIKLPALRLLRPLCVLLDWQINANTRAVQFCSHQSAKLNWQPNYIFAHSYLNVTQFLTHSFKFILVMDHKTIFSLQLVLFIYGILIEKFTLVFRFIYVWHS